MKLHNLMDYTEMEKRLHRQNKSRANIWVAIVYFGAAIAVTLLMGWGFGWPDLNDADYDHGDDYVPGQTYSAP